MQGTQDVGTVGEGSLLVKYPNGMRDLDHGLDDGHARHERHVNFYIEDSHVHKCRLMSPTSTITAASWCRHCIFDGAWGVTHGFTLAWGGRHLEIYDSTFQAHAPISRNMSGALLLVPCRATGVFTGQRASKMPLIRATTAIPINSTSAITPSPGRYPHAAPAGLAGTTATPT